MTVIEVEGLRKVYQRVRRFRRKTTVALNGLDLVVPEGGVFGFLGPNGSGKTTTIRCLLGLVHPTAGTARLLGASTERELAGVIDRVGAIVEAPALFPGFSGRLNLQLLGGIHGIGRQRVDETLARVGLADRADDRVKTYSLGMKQRLAIAAALLKDPRVLILDEPANGLDPAGIKEVRELIRSLGAEGRTVFLSSHILSEVRQVCDQVAILARGRCVTAGRVDDVLADGRGHAVEVRLDSPEELTRAAAVLERAGIALTVEGTMLKVQVPTTEASSITRMLAREDLFVAELRAEEVDLETVFLELTERPEEEPA